MVVEVLEKSEKVKDGDATGMQKERSKKDKTVHVVGEIDDERLMQDEAFTY